MALTGTRTAAVHAGPAGSPYPGSRSCRGRCWPRRTILDPDLGPQPGVDGYGRTDNASWRHLESAIADLEGAAAASCSPPAWPRSRRVLLSTLRPGDTVVLPSDGYYKTRVFAATRLVPLGVKVLEVPTAGPYPSTSTAFGSSLLETPANPGLDVCDIAAIAAAAHAAGALVAVDNTAATPLGQRPLALGADISVASGTKALTGHSDLLLGYVCAATRR